MDYREYIKRLGGDLLIKNEENTRETQPLTKCNTCHLEYDLGKDADSPGCPFCTSKLYQMLLEPPRLTTQQRAQVIYQHKKFGQGQQLTLDSPLALDSQPAAPSPASIVQKIRKRPHSPTTSSDHSLARMQDRQQRQLIATRDIAEGEIILQESPIISGPISRVFLVKRKLTPDGKESTSSPKFTSICLSCCRNVLTTYKCTLCGFPMCSQKCEEHADHAEFECKVFATNPVAPIVHVSEYRKILVLRCLLLREKDPLRWKKLMDMDPHEDLKSDNLSALTTSITICKFIQQECHQRQFDVETINRVVGISTVRSLNLYNSWCFPISEKMNNEYRKKMLIFYKAGLLAHDCIPNTHLSVDQRGFGTDKFTLTVVAAVAIPKGQILSTTLVDPTSGTFQRRSELLDQYHLSCTCRRCVDPTDLNTNLDALKCPKCTTGFLLPTNPLSLDLSAVWACAQAPICDCIIVTSQALDLLRKIRSDVEKCSVEHSVFQEYQNFQSLLNKYRGTILHENHFYIMNIQYSLLMVISQLLQVVNEDTALKLAGQQILLCCSCINVADLLRPGNNRIRGNLFYCFHEGLLLAFLVEARRQMTDAESNFAVTGRPQFEAILNIMKIARDALIHEPVGGLEHSRALKMSLDASGLQPLLRYFNIRTVGF